MSRCGLMRKKRIVGLDFLRQDRKKMKKAPLYALLLCLCGCAETGTFSEAGKSLFSRTVKNEKCEDIEAVKVFQVTKDFSLGNVCEESSYGISCFGHVVYIPKEKGKLYYDDQIIKPESGKCFSYSSTYQYEDCIGYLCRQRTVPVIEFVDEEISVKNR